LSALCLIGCLLLSALIEATLENTFFEIESPYFA